MQTTRKARRRLILTVSFCAFGLCSAAAGAQESCGILGGPNPLYNYTDPAHQGMIQTINANHFSENVETLISGQTATLQSDISFILNNAPNHHRALYAMARHHLREKVDKFPQESYSAQCWFDRAMRFAPRDAAVRMIFGVYLHRYGAPEEAERRYNEAIALSPGLGEAHYNLALLYIDEKRYDDALEHAHEAYRLAYPLPGVKQKLVAAGRWAEPAAVAAR